MSEHKATINWKRTSSTFDYNDYNREHTWTFDNGLTVEASAAPDFMGKAGIDPEETLVAATSGCHMLTFLAIASKKRLIVESYTDNPVGVLEKNTEGKMAVTTITLRPQITFSNETPVSEETLKDIHKKAHDNCFIANSIRASVIVE